MYNNDEDQRSIIALHKAINDFNAGKFLEEIPKALDARLALFKSLQADKNSGVGKTIGMLQNLSEVKDLAELAKPEQFISAWNRKISQWDIYDKVDAFHTYLTTNDLYTKINNGYHGVHENRTIWNVKDAGTLSVPLNNGYTTKNLLDTFKEYDIDLNQIDHKANYMLIDLIDHKIMANLIPHKEMLELRVQDRYLGLKKMPEDAGIEFPEFDFEYVGNSLRIKPDSQAKIYDLVNYDGGYGDPSEYDNSASEANKLEKELLITELEKRAKLKEALMQRDKDLENNTVNLEEEAAKEAALEATNNSDDTENNGVGAGVVAGVAAGAAAAGLAAGLASDKDKEEEREKTEEELRIEEEDRLAIEESQKDYSNENLANAPFNNPGYQSGGASTPRTESDNDIDTSDTPEDKATPAAPRNDSGVTEDIPSKIDDKATPDAVKSVNGQPQPVTLSNQQQAGGQAVYDPLYGLTKGIQSVLGGGAKMVKNALHGGQNASNGAIPSLTDMAGEMEMMSQAMQTSSGDDLTGMIDRLNKTKDAYEYAGNYKSDRLDNSAARKDIEQSLDVMKRVDQNIKDALENNSDVSDENRKKMEDFQKSIESFMEKMSQMITAMMARITGNAPAR
ncbi:hypothetical protein LMH73_003700 [Vibrio splendidus]|nr:hypothetical protein [Vibrio splendidus]MCC4882970.1 hypothetical protein [Vibrio splendidus]